jgi:hypothetical protein
VKIPLNVLIWRERCRTFTFYITRTIQVVFKKEFSKSNTISPLKIIPPQNVPDEFVRDHTSETSILFQLRNCWTSYALNELLEIKEGTERYEYPFRSQ